MFATRRRDVERPRKPVDEWNAGIAKHYFCRVCGVYPFHRKRSVTDHYGVNLACLINCDVDTSDPRRADGATMPVVSEDAREEWPGPRT